MKTVSNTILFIVIPLIVFGVLAGFQPEVQEDGDFLFSENDSTLTIYEHNQPVLRIVHGRMDPPEGIDSKYWRSNYVHPIFGLDGEKLTEDFPEDHPHHRGLFWTWPDVTFGNKKIDPWALEGARQLFRKWYHREAGEDQATISFESGWRLDEGWEPFVKEYVSITVHKANDIGRSIDFTLRFQNVSAKEVTLRGRGETGYGGFNIRPVGSRPGNKITTAEGVMEDDALVVDSGWADYSSLISDDTYAGLSIFQHPENPGFPHSGWILRHYGFLGASWPQYERLVLKPGETFKLKYRVFVHRGDADFARVEKKFENFVGDSSP